MAVTFQTPLNIGGVSWLLAWSSTIADATFYVWRDGELVLTTKALSSIFYIPADQSPTFDVFDAPEDLPTSQSGRVSLFWWTCADTSHYIISENLSGVWTEVDRLPDTGAVGFSWKSGWLADCTKHEWKVEPLGTNGNIGNPAYWTRMIVRVPDAPAQSFVYSAETGLVTIT